MSKQRHKCAYCEAKPTFLVERAHDYVPILVCVAHVEGNAYVMSYVTFMYYAEASRHPLEERVNWEMKGDVPLPGLEKKDS